MYGLWEHMELWRRARRLGMPLLWAWTKAAKPWERLVVLAAIAGPFVVFGAVWGATGSLLIAGGAILLTLFVPLLVTLPSLIKTIKHGESLPGTTWDGAKFTYRPPRPWR